MIEKRENILSSLDIRDPKAAFANAIKRGLTDPDNWMYMYTKNNKDYFKNRTTRNYRSYWHRWDKTKKEIKEKVDYVISWIVFLFMLILSLTLS